MGTPEFAVPSLDILLANGHTIVAIVTAPDKPAGRGLQTQQSAVKQYAISKGLTLLQPEKLKDPIFIEQLQNLKADLQVVVAFRMLPEIVWNMPPLGTINLHASLLPQYRGAAPINWAIINGETMTGVTSFLLEQEIDTGKIIFTSPTEILENETAGQLHDRLMQLGATLVLQTVKAITSNEHTLKPQEIAINEKKFLQHAPKLFKENTKIDWAKSTQEIHNLVRGLNPYPSAWAELMLNEKLYSVKIFQTEREQLQHTHKIGTVLTDFKTYLKIAVNDGFIIIVELQLAGKKRLFIKEFLRGLQAEKPKLTFI